MTILLSFRMAVAIAQSPSSSPALQFREAEQWTYREFLADAALKALKKPRPNPGGIEFRPPIPSDRVEFDYFSNSVTLGRPLAEGERIRFDYQVIAQFDAVDAGVCTIGDDALDPSFFDGKAKNVDMTFVNGETIQRWFIANMNGDGAASRNKTGGAILLSGAPGEEHVEFRRDSSEPSGRKRVGLMDARIRGATAQFIAAGSFGYVHSTIIPWAEAGNQKVVDTLNAAFDLSSRCLTELANPNNSNRELDGMLLAAPHEYAQKR